ncbi:MAG TPA: hypothetical protein VHY21_12840, partial [Pseudonocardiaceae bacterium]|nr:hypothetical protein [Pseudonocardiaceae bacterium]
MFATRITPLRAVVAAAALTAVLPATAAAASASSSSSTAPDTPVTRVADFIASPSALGSAGGLITLSAVVKNATSCVFSAQPAVSGLPATVACSSGTVQENVTLPANAATTPVKYTFGLAVTGSTTVTARPVKFVVSGDGTQKGFVSTASNYGGYCGLLSSGGVDCWGWNDYGTLGNGTSVSYSKVAQPVSGIGGAGVLTGAVSVVSDDNASTCAVLTSSGVACWGINDHGELGDGTTPYYSAVPTAVVGVGGTGTLSGVLSLTPVADTGYCALLTSGGVDCWGGNTDGQLGDGTMTGPDNCAQGACADTPVPVSGVGGTGQLSGVAGLAGNGGSGYCAVLSSGGVDCWGAGPDPSLVPVPVPGAGGVGVLSGVMSVVGDGIDLCALLTSGGVDCWGQNTYGELGNGTTTDGPYPGPVSGA